MKIRMGRIISAASHSVRLMASSGRRIRSPHLPPEQYCTISSAKPPSAKPQQRMAPISQEVRRWRNPSWSINSASTTSTIARMVKTAPNVSARRRHPAKRAEEAPGSPVRARVAFPCAFVTVSLSSCALASFGSARFGRGLNLLARFDRGRSRNADGVWTIPVFQLILRMPAGIRGCDVFGRRHCGRSRTRRRGIDRSGRLAPRLRIARRQDLLRRHFAQLLHPDALQHIALLRVLAQLECANIGSDGPAIGCLDLSGVVRHGAITVRDDREVVAQRLSQPVRVVEVSRGLIATLANHAGAVANARGAGGAGGIEFLLGPLGHCQGDRKGQSIDFLSVLETGMKEVS